MSHPDSKKLKVLMTKVSLSAVGLFLQKLWSFRNTNPTADQAPNNVPEAETILKKRHHYKIIGLSYFFVFYCRRSVK